ncbi:hypothetical protein DVH05_012263 [Phytophthora capsici]|nr:hypothetical protein DVH05_012263 [Phytophthora capsici]
MNSPTPKTTSAAADAQASPAASAASTTAAVPTSTAASSRSTESKLSVSEYHALLKEKHAAKKSDFAADSDEYPLDYEDSEDGELREEEAPAHVSSSEDTLDPPKGSRRPREEASDASRSKRPRNDDLASPMSRALISPRTDPPPVRAAWMPTEAEIHDRSPIASVSSMLAIATTLTPCAVSVNASMKQAWKRGSCVPFPSAHPVRVAHLWQHVSPTVIYWGTRRPVYPIT